MRAFIAIELPPQIKESLGRLQEQLKLSGADVKWVNPQNIHLTLKFLGERDDKKIAAIKDILEEAVKNKTAFEAGIGSLGAFPKTDAPRVIWVGIGKGEEQIKEIAEELDTLISRTGIPKVDRAYAAHITLGRTRSGRNQEGLARQIKELAQSIAAGNLEFAVAGLTLFESTLTPSGPVYKVQKVAGLKTN